MAKVKGDFTGWLKKYASSDVIIAGAGPSGLMTAIDLARLDLKILLIERNSYAGGRLWESDFLISSSIFMAQLRGILDDLRISYKKGKDGLFTKGGPNISSKLVLAACDAGVKILNLAEFSDVIYGDENVEGVIMNWRPQLSLKSEVTAVIPVVLKSQIVVDATGIGAQVYQSLKKRGVKEPHKFEPVDIRISEELLLEKTGILYPGLASAGMAVAAIYGIPQGGLTLCSMLLSGRKAAQEVEMFFAENYILPPKTPDPIG